METLSLARILLTAREASEEWRPIGACEARGSGSGGGGGARLLDRLESEHEFRCFRQQVAAHQRCARTSTPSVPAKVSWPAARWTS